MQCSYREKTKVTVHIKDEGRQVLCRFLGKDLGIGNKLVFFSTDGATFKKYN